MLNNELARAAERLMIAVHTNDAQNGLDAASSIAQQLGGDPGFPYRVDPNMTTMYLLALLVRAYAVSGDPHG